MTRILFMSSGVVVWALHFGTLYGLTALACARGWQPLLVPSIAVATAIAALATISIIAAGLRRRAQFESWMGAGIAALALVAIVWDAMPVLVVPPCR